MSITKAPEIESPLGWLNTDRPLRLEHELRGHVIVLDFWTFCCINCLHILPDLKFLEDKYRNEPFVVIGVHSAKFTNEASRQTVRAAIHRYNIEHPVVVDDQMSLWKAYRARSWPTFVVIDPEGFVAETLSGEGRRDALDRVIGKLLTEHRGKGSLARQPVDIQRDAVVEPATALAFPGKVLADNSSNRLFIADTNHHRIVITTLPNGDGKCQLIDTVGRGSPGAADGPFEDAEFRQPQGMAISGDILYIADTENHTIRAADLKNRTVTTAVGTGQMGYDRAGGAMGTQQEISSPWDLAMEGCTLYVAMAGLHQIWRIEMPIGFARAFAGSGRENIVDGPVETAALSQPSGLCLHRGKIFVADSEVSAIRGIDLASEQVFTVVGQGLFVFGDVDGPHPQARLQHCLGVAPWHDNLIVADSYNHKIKLVNPTQATVSTLYGTGQPCAESDDGKLGLHEPGGLNVAADVLYIADTNNHRVVRVDLKSHEWSEVKIDGLTRPMLNDDRKSEPAPCEPITLKPGVENQLTLDITLPPAAHVNAEAPYSIRIAENATVLAQHTSHTHSLMFNINIPPTADQSEHTWDVTLSFVYCTDDQGGQCIPGEFAWRLPVRFTNDAPAQAMLAASLFVTSPIQTA